MSNKIVEKLSNDFIKVLNSKEVKSLWDALTPIAQRDFISWVESAKGEETRRRRIESIPSRLLSGKRRPCCYAIVPMSLYKALDTNPRAKAVWKSLTPDERRDVVAKIDSVKDKAAKVIKIDEVITTLATGKKFL
jgi:uncharacterized protein YdeI (YjbR/CyaY-like superfamily)